MENKNLTWNNFFKPLNLKDVELKKNRIIGLTFPRVMNNLGLEPSVLSVLPDDEECEYCLDNRDFNDNSVRYYLCSVYISGMDEFIKWSTKHSKEKIIVGGYHPTTFPEDFKIYAHKIVKGLCTDFWKTISQEGQIVNGILSNTNTSRRDLYDINVNQQIIPDKKINDVCCSISTSIGCPNRCDFCCSPLMSPKIEQMSNYVIEEELKVMQKYNSKFCFIRDENFTMQKDWKQRLKLIHKYLYNTKLYLFASANTLNEEHIIYMKNNGVYMICLGLEDINTSYSKNNNLDEVCKLLRKHGIYIYLSFIVNPLDIVGTDKGKDFYKRLLNRFYELKPEMVCGNFLMPFRGTALWDKYYHLVSKNDYKYYDSKTPFLVKNEILQEKMKFFMFYYQYIYYNSELYNNEIRKFNCNDTLNLRFEKELKDKFYKSYELIYDKRP